MEGTRALPRIPAIPTIAPLKASALTTWRRSTARCAGVWRADDSRHDFFAAHTTHTDQTRFPEFCIS